MCYNNLKGAKYRSIYLLIKTNGFWCPILFIFFADIPIFVTPISSMIFYHCFRWTDIFCWKPFREGLLDDSRFLKIFFCMFPFDMFTNRLRHFTTMKKFNKIMAQSSTREFSVHNAFSSITVSTAFSLWPAVGMISSEVCLLPSNSCL